MWFFIFPLRCIKHFKRITIVNRFCSSVYVTVCNPPFLPYYRFVALNKHHTYFLLVDNGTVGKYGPELILRRKLENYISKQRIETRKCHTVFTVFTIL